ncbi:bifunctional diaminohydroxyphosphoribosylaminopyrimidine deaminase/5-amino-6-(5-phosphoribosylamino)uracil reductase RibD [Rickettsiella endosymbiont of Dermanyssus gallinae]|uniref:bifunctional diaminohydroxyphosphoribosylaminopyrimidine deaminase/5-amino-6-(5-phosphoribosylamino)uracil reductase RibD n=1 Tax=Rickettsiella endosymbiont of Dermanyssus gallinae TaxID=2856608 RepID=UPI001C52E13B|nr:bifunctional diaminohydroxyphosphoribosylaminopyrimidine deaminase/5-amino-6-(5-phosphoribosylamino)uracil reductase RibD [Rickettsiella endosymbiont of Dermanyssus gallinae]
MNNLDITYLQQALELAKLRRGFCAPNPCVGAVLVKDGKVIASGYHLASGSAHAEVEALNKIDASVAKGATLYVTLQPCCHTAKKTPPCTQLLIAKKIAKVVYAFRDPNPAVSDHSDQQLQQAGIVCTQQSLPEIDDFYASYQFWWKHQQPFVTAKLAISLDGKVAGQHGQRIQLTGEAAQRFTHQQRQRADAILSTAKTISNDNPLLNVRIDNATISKPLYILDSELNTPLSAHVFNTAKKITLFHKMDLSSKKQIEYHRDNVQLVGIKTNLASLNLDDVLKHIGQDRHHDLWVEAGGHCFQSFAQNQLLQRAFIYVAPLWLGQDAQNAFTDPQVFSKAKPAAPILLGPDSCFIFNWP